MDDVRPDAALGSAWRGSRISCSRPFWRPDESALVAFQSGRLRVGLGHWGSEVDFIGEAESAITEV